MGLAALRYVGFSWIRDWTCVPCIGRWILIHCTTREVHNLYPSEKSFRGRTMERSCCVWFFATPWTAARQTSLSFTISWSLLRLMSIESVMPSNCVILSLSRFSLCPQSFPASGSFPMSRLFPLSGQSIRALASSSSPFSELSGLISLRIDWFDLLAVQETLKSLLQHHNSKDQFFHAQPSLLS